MITPNWANRTMWTGDNLDILRGMNSESVDLIYLDPPFNSNRTYSALSAPKRQEQRSRIPGPWTMSMSPGTEKLPSKTLPFMPLSTLQELHTARA